MTDLKIYLTNAIALAISITEVDPWLQRTSLVLAIIYTLLNIYKKIK